MTSSRPHFGLVALLLSAVGCAAPPPGATTAASQASAHSVDRLAIRELLERFTDAVNHRQFEILPTLFTERAVWEAKLPPDAGLGLGEGFHFSGPEGIRAGLAQSRERAEPLFYSVLPGPIELHADGRATSRSTMYELLHVKTNDTALELVGTYSDTFREERGVWRFESRIFRLRHATEVPLPRHRAAP